MAMPIFGYAVDFRPDLVEYSFKKACKLYLSSGAEVRAGAPIQPGFWIWQDRKLKREIRDYRKLLPSEIEIVRPAIYGGDKDLLLTAELNYSEFGYVFITLKDGTVKFQPIIGKVGKPAITRGEFVDAIASLLLEIGSVDNVRMVVVTHTHPHVNFTTDLGMNVVPAEFSDEDLEGASYLKYYFEVQGIFFPLQFEIVYSKITETDKFTDSGQVAKKALLFPHKMSTDIRDVPNFDDQMKSFLSSGWEATRNKPLTDRLKRILSVGR
ncbi:MAG: hypothetical protein AB7P49_08275 [Bdellovibrionales bacterium]